MKQISTVKRRKYLKNLKKYNLFLIFSTFLGLSNPGKKWTAENLKDVFL